MNNVNDFDVTIFPDSSSSGKSMLETSVMQSLAMLGGPDKYDTGKSFDVDAPPVIPAGIMPESSQMIANNQSQWKVIIFITHMAMATAALVTGTRYWIKNVQPTFIKFWWEPQA